MSMHNPDSDQMARVQIPLEMIINRLRVKLEEAEWRIVLLESQIDMQNQSTKSEDSSEG